jgi:hypothetical protein
MNTASLPIVSAVEEACPICLEALSDGCVLLSVCGHPAHKPCVQASVRAGNYNCPICRAPYSDMSEAAAPEAGDKRFRKFSNMLRVSVPPAAVRQRMEADGIPPSLIDAFFTGGAVHDAADMTAEAEAHQKRLDGQCLQAFTAMLRVGLPEAAVRQKMRAAGVSDRTIASFFCEVEDGCTSGKG